MVCVCRGSGFYFSYPAYGLSAYSSEGSRAPLDREEKIKTKLIMLTVFVLFILACGMPPSPTPEPTTDIMQAIASTQTAAAFSLPASTFTSVSTQTLVVFPTDTITSVPVIESTSIPTFTQVVFTPAVGPSAGACSCSGDSLNCSDFSTHSGAQACYSYCVSLGKGDIHNLDSDGDGDVCESLP